MSDIAAATGAGKDQRAFPEFYAQYFHTQNLPKRGAIVAVAPLKYKGQHAIARDIANLKSALAQVNVTAGFLPVVAPASALPGAKLDYYKDEESYFAALADALDRQRPRVAVYAGARLERPQNLDISYVSGQHDDSCPSEFATNRDDGLDAVHLRHLQIHQCHIRPVHSKLLYRLKAIGSLCDEFHVGLSGQELRDSVAKK